MIEVFKTDVKDLTSAVELLNHINTHLPAYQVNFDLSDCDRVLRIKKASGYVEAGGVVEVMIKLSHKAERWE